MKAETTGNIIRWGLAGALIFWLYTRMANKDISAKEAEEGAKLEPGKSEEPMGREAQLIAGLDPSFQPKVRAFLAAARAAGHKIILVAGRRTIADQKALYAKGRTAPGSKVTNADGGESPHNYGMAIDFAFLDASGKASWPEKGDWKGVAKFGKDQGMEWGGDWASFQDRPHLELPGWKQMRADWKAGKLMVA